MKVTDEVKTAQGVILFETIEVQSQVDDLAETLGEGYKEFSYVGAGLILLTKDKVDLNAQDANTLSRLTRFDKEWKKGKVFDVSLESGATLTVKYGSDRG